MDFNENSVVILTSVSRCSGLPLIFELSIIFLILLDLFPSNYISFKFFFKVSMSEIKFT